MNIKYENNNKNEYHTRLNKLIEIKKNGFLFPNTFKPNYSYKDIYLKYSHMNKEELKKINITVKIAGRIIQRRIIGKATFINLYNENEIIQIYIKSNNLLNPDNYFIYIQEWDLGDILGITGKIFKTNTGQLSINCINIELLTKSLRSLPNKFHGLIDQELRYRLRYLDLIMNQNVKNIFTTRSNIIKNIRNFMHNNHFIEVETPILQTIPGGASARPFITFHNTLNKNMYLRIAPELYLKRLIVGGFQKIFEINKNFRNEGMSTKHNPEFTMMEVYIAYADYKDMMKLIQNLLKKINHEINQNHITKYKNHIFDFSKNYEELTMKESIIKYVPNIKKEDLYDINKITKIMNKLKIKYDINWKIGKLINEIFEKYVEKNLIQPTFITEYPIEVSPLSRRNNLDKNIADRFEFFIGGYEIANGFSELNDSEDQKIRFNKQLIKQQAGDQEAMFYDKEYITALEHGLPPTAGLGIGIDRLIMILTNQNSIRDVILFPTMKTNQQK
ncbi:Lysine--tRNA ligase [Buchnera aphidicola (Eriosoma grossulariae)]|uniref:lysine--tRNA ligase n=1 Tax=Buchnera aphidicola TaxID=9 RepID=UPI003463C994